MGETKNNIYKKDYKGNVYKAENYRFNTAIVDKDGKNYDGSVCTNKAFLKCEQFIFNEYGFDRLGFDTDGFNADGYDHYGFDGDGLNKKGFDIDGLDKDGYDEYGYNADGFNNRGFGRDGFNEDGYDEEGYNEDGFDEDGYNHEDYDEDGCDRNGINEWLRAKVTPDTTKAMIKGMLIALEQRKEELTEALKEAPHDKTKF